MRVRGELTAIVLLGVGLAGALTLTSPGDGRRGVTAALEDVPAYKLSFKAGKPIPGVSASPALSIPMQCSPDGEIFVEEGLPPGFRQRSVVLLSSKGGRGFDLNLVPDLYDGSLRSFFPSDSELAMLVLAAREKARRDDGGGTTVGKTSAERNFHVVLFKPDGRYQSTIELSTPREMQYRKIGVLDSGEFVLLGYDGANRVPVIHLFSADGRYERAVSLPSAMAGDSEVEKGRAGDMQGAERAGATLSFWQFAMVRHRLILYDPVTASPVLEVGAGGFVREVPIASPEGYQLDGVLPGTSRWVARFRRKDIALTGSEAKDSTSGSNNFLLYDVNPGDGSLRMRLEPSPGQSVFDIACEADGVLTAINTDDGTHFVPYTAELPK